MKKIIILLSLVLVFSIAALTFVPAAADDEEVFVYEEGDYILGVPIAFTVAEFRKAYASRPTAILMNLDGVTEFDDDDLIGTGFSVRFWSEVGETKTLYIVVRGDTTGDGLITTTDYIKIRAHLKNVIPLEGVFLKAADVNNDGSVTTFDYLAVKAHFRNVYGLYSENRSPKRPDSPKNPYKDVYPIGWR